MCSGSSTPQHTTVQDKRHGSRGSSFTPTEDEAIAKAWIAVSENPIVGVEQKGNDFFTSVQDMYNDKFKPPNREIRTMESVKTRSKTMHKECMKFAACHIRVVRMHPTGVSLGDMINMATALYNGMEMTSVEDDCGKPFRFIKSWRILRNHEKYMGGGEVSRKSDSNKLSPETSVEGGAELIHSEAVETSACKVRPVGRKRAKSKEQKNADTAKKIRLAAESVGLQRERNEALKRHYEILLFTNAPPGCDNSQSVQYFNIMRSRALAEIRKQEEGTDVQTVD